MGIIDAFKEEDRATVTISQLYKMLREAAKTELLINAWNSGNPISPDNSE